MTKVTFTLVPYVSVGQLQFGMAVSEVIERLGEPSRRRERGGVVRLVWDSGWTAAVFRNGELDEVEFAPGEGSQLVVDGIAVLDDRSALRRLCAADPSVLVTDDGLLLFPRLGIAASGLHPRRLEDLSVTAFTRGNWEKRKAFPSRPFTIPVAVD